MKATRNLLATLILGCTATVAMGAPSTLRKNGECRLQTEAEKAFKVNLGNADVDMVTEVKGGDFFGKFTLEANPTIANKSGRKLHIAYYAAFFDASGELIACASQNSEVDAGAKGLQFGSCLSPVARQDFDRIVSYKISVYVNEAKDKK
jgi:hypothetical protein